MLERVKKIKNKKAVIAGLIILLLGCAVGVSVAKYVKTSSIKLLSVSVDMADVELTDQVRVVAYSTGEQTVGITDPESETGPYTYTITDIKDPSGNPTDKITGTDGVITINGAPASEDPYTMKVTVEDKYGHSDDATYTVYVVDFESNKGFYRYSDTESHYLPIIPMTGGESDAYKTYAIGEVSGTAPDGGTLTSPASHFEISEDNSIVVKPGTPVGEYDLEITATYDDEKGNNVSITKTYHVTVSDIGMESTSKVLLFNWDTAQDVTAGSASYDIPPEESDVTYTIPQTEGFTVADPKKPVITVAAATPVGKYIIPVTASDTKNPEFTTTQDCVIYVVDLADKEGSYGYNNRSSQTMDIDPVAGIPTDELDGVSYSITSQKNTEGNNVNNFTVKDGKIVIAKSTPVGDYTLTLKASSSDPDFGDTSVEATYVIHISSELALEGKTVYLPASDNDQNVTITDATLGSGNYSYAITEQPDADSMTISSGNIVIPAGTSTGLHTIKIRATDNETPSTADATYTVYICELPDSVQGFEYSADEDQRAAVSPVIGGGSADMTSFAITSQKDNAGSDVSYFTYDRNEQNIKIAKGTPTGKYTLSVRTALAEDPSVVLEAEYTIYVVDFESKTTYLPYNSKEQAYNLTEASGDGTFTYSQSSTDNGVTYDSGKVKVAAGEDSTSVYTTYITATHEESGLSITKPYYTYILKFDDAAFTYTMPVSQTIPVNTFFGGDGSQQVTFTAGNMSSLPLNFDFTGTDITVSALGTDDETVIPPGTYPVRLTANAYGVELTATYTITLENAITLNGGSQAYEYSEILDRYVVLDPAQGGSGNYTYSITSQKDSQKNDVEYFSVDSNSQIKIAKGTPAGIYKVGMHAVDNKFTTTADAEYTIYIIRGTDVSEEVRRSTEDVDVKTIENFTPVGLDYSYTISQISNSEGENDLDYFYISDGKVVMKALTPTGTYYMHVGASYGDASTDSIYRIVVKEPDLIGKKLAYENDMNGADKITDTFDASGVTNGSGNYTYSIDNVERWNEEKQESGSSFNKTTPQSVFTVDPDTGMVTMTDAPDGYYKVTLIVHDNVYDIDAMTALYINNIVLEDAEVTLVRDATTLNDDGSYSIVFSEDREEEKDGAFTGTSASTFGYESVATSSVTADDGQYISVENSDEDGRTAKINVAADTPPGTYTVEVTATENGFEDFATTDASGPHAVLVNADNDTTATFTVKVPLLHMYRDDTPSGSALYTVADGFESSNAIPDKTEGTTYQTPSITDAVKTAKRVRIEPTAGYPTYEQNGRVTVSERAYAGVTSARLPYKSGYKPKEWKNVNSGESNVYQASNTVTEDKIFVPVWEGRSTLMMQGTYDYIWDNASVYVAGEGFKNMDGTPFESEAAVLTGCESSGLLYSGQHYGISDVLSNLLAETGSSGTKWKVRFVSSEAATADTMNGDVIMYDESEAEDAGVVAYYKDGYLNISTQRTGEKVIANTTMAFAFRNLPVISLNTENLDTQNTYNYRGMFANIDTGDRNTVGNGGDYDLSNLFQYKGSTGISCQGMFFSNKNIYEVDMTGTDMSNIVTMDRMFQETKNLAKITFGPDTDTSKVKSLYRTFDYTNLKVIDMRYIDMDNLYVIYGIFANDPQLQIVVAPDNDFSMPKCITSVPTTPSGGKAVWSNLTQNKSVKDSSGNLLKCQFVGMSGSSVGTGTYNIKLADTRAAFKLDFSGDSPLDNSYRGLLTSASWFDILYDGTDSNGNLIINSDGIAGYITEDVTGKCIAAYGASSGWKDSLMIRLINTTYTTNPEVNGAYGWRITAVPGQPNAIKISSVASPNYKWELKTDTYYKTGTTGNAFYPIFKSNNSGFRLYKIGGVTGIDTSIIKSEITSNGNTLVNLKQYGHTDSSMIFNLAYDGKVIHLAKSQRSQGYVNGALNTASLSPLMTMNLMDEGSAEEITVTFDTNGGSEVPDIKVKAGEAIGKMPEPVRAGFHIDYWMSADGTFVDSDYVPEHDMTVTAFWKAGEPENTSADEEASTGAGASYETDTTETAPSLPDEVRSSSYIITFISDGEEGSSMTVIKAGNTIGKLPSATKEGYVFKGWYTENGTKVTERYIPRGDLKLTAFWTAE